ncbi:hypothetical protein L6466_13460 [Prevotella communis]|uniref:hypothetical protein n=1 Tax=Prevotella communis TaxID=2913614 RepID=UPI001EDC4E75|nr:hypothetical protein [Prevotella communis]UKK67553.1 hypothetical protein L6464_13205 [Prevotella communis]UKK70300.1 hypothetical protein L6466_13460 [Prevotella communis]
MNFICKNWKKILMLLVIIGAIICAIISFLDKQYVVGVLSGLTVIVPVIIWFSDDKDNQVRDEKIDDLDKEQKSNVKVGETVGYIPNIDLSAFKEQRDKP